MSWFIASENIKLNSHSIAESSKLLERIIVFLTSVLRGLLKIAYSLNCPSKLKGHSCPVLPENVCIRV